MPGILSGNSRAYAAGGQARFRNPITLEPTDRVKAGLQPNHPALSEGRTIFPKSVFDASQRDHVLIPGINNAKTGNDITVGPWAGFRHFNLSLEERATCPRSCDNYSECFGNGMPVAVRFLYNDNLLESLEFEISQLAGRFPHGFSVRLHILGDFPDVDYVKIWRVWMQLFPALHVWGYTARSPDSPIGREIIKANETQSDQWVIRFSVPDNVPHGDMQVSTTWKKPEKYAFDQDSQSLICPQELGKTDHCTTCGICWNPKLRHVRVRFLGHGGRGRHPKDAKNIPENIPNQRIPAPLERFDDVAAFIAARGVTRKC